MLDHFLEVGQLIIERIEAELPNTFALVAHAADLAGVQDSGQIVPACYVVYLGANLVAQVRSDRPQQPHARTAWDQDWMTVIVVRSVTGIKGRSGAMDLAGPLAGKLAKTLPGWEPKSGARPLEALPPGVPPLSSDHGTLYLPLRWRTRVTEFA